MFCSNCGANNADGAKFCGSCGNPMPTPAPVEKVEAPVEPVVPVMAPPVVEEPTPVAPVAPVYAPAEPAAPAPAPQKPKKKNNVIIIAIVAVIAVIAIVVGVLFGTGVIGGDKKKEEETTKKTESTTEAKEEEKKPDFKYAEVMDSGKFFIAVDDAGNPIFNEYDEVTVYETDDAGQFVYDADGKPKTYPSYLQFILNGTIYSSGMAIKVPAGWKLIEEMFVEDGIYNEETQSAIIFEDYYGTADTLEAVAMEYIDAVDESTVSFEYDLNATQINGKEAIVIMADAVVEDDICVSHQFVIIEVDGEFYCFFFTTPDAESFDFVSFVETNVTFY